MKRKIVAILVSISAIFLMSCASCERELKSCQSDVSGGLNRIVNVYSLDGDLIASYEGLIYIDDNQNGSVMFDMNGKRYVYYNAIVEVIEK